MNIKIPGESVRTKEDATKFLKDIEADVVDDGWVEHERKLDDQNKKYNKELYSCMKDRLVNCRFSFNYKPGQWESIFGGKREKKEE